MNKPNGARHAASRVRFRIGGTMSRYLRMVMLLLAGLCFMIPMLGRSASARPMPRFHGPHGSFHNNPHQALEPDPDLGDDAAPCAP